MHDINENFKEIDISVQKPKPKDSFGFKLPTNWWHTEEKHETENHKSVFIMTGKPLPKQTILFCQSVRPHSLSCFNIDSRSEDKYWS